MDSIVDTRLTRSRARDRLLLQPSAGIIVALCRDSKGRLGAWAGLMIGTGEHLSWPGLAEARSHRTQAQRPRMRSIIMGQAEQSWTQRSVEGSQPLRNVRESLQPRAACTG